MSVHPLVGGGGEALDLSSIMLVRGNSKQVKRMSYVSARRMRTSGDTELSDPDILVGPPLVGTLDVLLESTNVLVRAIPMEGDKVDLSTLLLDEFQELAEPVEFPGDSGTAKLNPFGVVRPDLLHEFGGSAGRAHVGLAADIRLVESEDILGPMFREILLSRVPFAFIFLPVGRCKIWAMASGEKFLPPIVGNVIRATELADVSVGPV